MQPFLAMITPLTSGGEGSPPGTWGGASEPFPGYGLPPAGPGKPPSSPPGFWGGSSEPFPGYGLPGKPPGTWGGSPVPWPTPPIHYPPGIWGPTDPRPGWGLPGPQPPTGSPPGFWGGSSEPFPGYGLPGSPPGTWGGSGQPFPQPPIELPPNLPPETGDGNKIEWKTAWTPQTGWIVVGIPQVPHPAPSK